MANSINTNRGALVALQTLNATNKALETTQNRVNTGMKVSSAKDNGAIFAIATSQRAEMGAQDAVKQSLQRGQSIIDVALAAGETVVDALTELKSLAVAIQDDAGNGVSPATDFSVNGKKLVADFESLVKEVHTALAGATFDGVNLFKGTASNAPIEVSINTSGSKFNLKGGTAAAEAVSATGGALALGGTVDATTLAWTAPTTYAAQKSGYTAANVDAAINAFTTTLADLGTGPGLPGIPLAVTTPALQVTLVESNGKKARFLREAARQLKLDNVTVAESRIEAFQPGTTFDAITARALATLPLILQLGGHLLGPSGTLLAMKGVVPEDEIAALPADWQVRATHPLQVPGLAAERHLVEVVRTPG